MLKGRREHTVYVSLQLHFPVKMAVTKMIPIFVQGGREKRDSRIVTQTQPYRILTLRCVQLFVRESWCAIKCGMCYK